MAKSSVNVSYTQNAECSPNSVGSKLNDWTKEDVRQWLIDVVKVPEECADILYKEDVSGAALICFDKKDFLDAGLKHGPAVQILKNVSQFKTSLDVSPEDTAAFLETSTPANEPNDPQITPKLSVQQTSSVKTWSSPLEHTSENTGNEGRSLTPGFQEDRALISGEQDDLKCQKRGGASRALRLCEPRPFDKDCPTFEYTQNEILPPEAGPSNLIDPVHEFKLMANTKNVSEKDVLNKFTNELFWFAAGCMNSRTNGTIHFGVGDKLLYKHGQIIGIEITSSDIYIRAFYKGLKEHFTNHTSIVKSCIRPPKFFKVKCPDDISMDKWIIEVDVVPMYELTLEKRFYTAIDRKRRKSKCLFIRDGESTRNYIAEAHPKRKRQNEKNLKNDIKLWASSRRLAEEWHGPIQETKLMTLCPTPEKEQ